MSFNMVVITKKSGFTLIELLIVIGLLGALATLLLSSFSADRTKTLDTSIVAKEMSDIQRAFQLFYVDCVPSQEDLKRITLYGLEILCVYDDTRGWSFDKGWDSARGKGWRGPYIQSEGRCGVDVSEADGIAVNKGQPPATTTFQISVIYTPYADDEDGRDGDYYRVIPEVDESGNVTQLWLVFPSHSGELAEEVITKISEHNPEYESEIAKESKKRRLILTE